MTSLTDPQGQVSSFTYDPEGNLTTAILPNGVVTTNTYDPDGRLSQTKSDKGTTTLQLFNYAYDQNGNRTSQTDRLGQQTTYSYDALNRLTSFNPPALPATTYSYDPAGNRTAAGATTYNYNALNQLISSSDGTSYSYDAAGRLATKTRVAQTTRYSWDGLDQLTEISDELGSTRFSYDGLGRRSERTASGQTETAHYGDLTDLPILDTNSAGQIVRSYVQGPAGLIEERAENPLGGLLGGGTMETTYPLPDAHGDITTISDGVGDVASRQSYDPWGVQSSGPSRQMGYLGAYQRRTDPALSLLQMGARQYEPGAGRFLSEDPVLGALGVGASVNRYPYAYDNPLNLYDLDGRFLLPVGPSLQGPLDSLTDATDAAVDIVNGPSPYRPSPSDTLLDRAQDFVQYSCEGWMAAYSLGCSVIDDIANSLIDSQGWDPDCFGAICGLGGENLNEFVTDNALACVSGAAAATAATPTAKLHPGATALVGAAGCLGGAVTNELTGGGFHAPPVFR